MVNAIKFETEIIQSIYIPAKILVARYNDLKGTWKIIDYIDFALIYKKNALE